MERKLRLGIAGLGRAFSLMIPTFARDARVAVVAGADPRPEARARFASDFVGAKGYESVEDLCADPAVEVVYISTPHQFHAEQVRIAARYGKHVLVEKPMALTLEDCGAMIAAAREAGVHLVVGHSHSFDAPVARARDLIAAGTFGPLRMITAINYTDFLYRPRRPEELDTAQGGGVIFNQAPHQVDVVRFIGGGRVRSVRAQTGAWDRVRATEGAYTALLTFENGACASLTYSGYAHFDSDELCDWIGESGQAKDARRYGAARRLLAGASGEAEVELKGARNYGGPDYAGPSLSGASEPRFHQHFGFVVASCDHADLRPTAKGVMVYDDAQARFEPVPVPDVHRAEVIDELYAAVVSGHPAVHSGEWAMATMEVCLAMLQSAREQREILLAHQVGIGERTIS